MASITTTQASDGKPRYTVNYRDSSGTQRRKRFTNLGAAKNFAATVEADKARGVYLNPDAGQMTFAEYMGEWLDSRAMIRSSRDSVEVRLRNHVTPVIGHLRLNQVKPSTIQKLLNGMSGAPSSKRLILMHVSSIFAMAVDDDRIAKNPCVARSVTKPRSAQRVYVVWTKSQVDGVTDELPQRYRLAARIGSGLGLRQGEVFGLALDDVDFEGEVVHVRRQVKIVGSQRVFDLPKYGKVRTVPLPTTLAAAIREHVDRYPAKAVTLPWAEPEATKTETARLLITTRERGAVNRNYFNPGIWKPALKRAGIKESRQNGMHALRHWYGSALLDAGEAITVVSRNLGHSDPSFTLRVYSHPTEGHEDRTRAAIDALFDGARS